MLLIVILRVNSKIYWNLKEIDIETRDQGILKCIICIEGLRKENERKKSK